MLWPTAAPPASPKPCGTTACPSPPRMLSRAASVLRGKTLIVNLPGSPKAVKENLEYILPSLEHGIRIAAGLDGECARK